MDEITSYVTDAYKYTIPLRPSAKEYLEAMAKKGVKMCILTASEAGYIQPALDRLDIRKYFDCILTCTELGVYKEDGKAFPEPPWKKWVAHWRKLPYSRMRSMQ